MMAQKNRLDHLDGLRGFAAVGVVIFHLMSALFPWLVPDQHDNAAWIAYTPVAVAWNGPFAVSVFFVLSGFVVTNATVRKSDPLWIDVVIRYVRLAVPATLSTLLAWALLTALPDQARALQALTHSRWLRWTYQDAIPGLPGAAYSGAVGIFLDGTSFFNNVLWTMRPELIGSLICFGVCVLRTARSRSVAALAMFILILLLGRTEYECFIVGICLREMWAAGRLPSRFAVPALLAGLILGSPSGDAARLFGLQWLPAALAVGTKNSLLYPLAAGMIVYGCMNAPAVIRLLSGRVGRFLGAISFPLYLIHVPLIDTVFARAYRSAYPDIVGGAAIIATFAVVVVFLSLLAEVFVERPFLRLLGRVRHRLRVRFTLAPS